MQDAQALHMTNKSTAIQSIQEMPLNQHLRIKYCMTYAYSAMQCSTNTVSVTINLLNTIKYLAIFIKTK